VSLANNRSIEHAKYVQIYAQRPRYRMGQERKADAVNDLEALPARGSYLDVSCGRGEMIREALRLGFLPCHGTEIVPQLVDGVTVVRAEVHALPFADKSFDVATMFDVIEHLIPGDDERACRELARVARKHVLLTANNRSSSKTGVELHINRRPYETWDRLFTKWFAPARATWIKGARNYVSEAWRIDL
jgi:ubiquinone/menaquinone biosynthesis C-methylase UbiE